MVEDGLEEGGRPEGRSLSRLDQGMSHRTSKTSRGSWWPRHQAGHECRPVAEGVEEGVHDEVAVAVAEPD